MISPSSPGSLTTGLGDGSSWSLPGRAMRTVPGRPEGQRRGRASAGGPQQPSVPRRPRAGAWTLVGLGATHGRPDTGAGCSMDAAARKDRAGKGARRALGDGVERHTATRGRAARAASSTPLCPRVPSPVPVSPPGLASIAKRPPRSQRRLSLGSRGPRSRAGGPGCLQTRVPRSRRRRRVCESSRSPGPRVRAGPCV